jgi:NAD(P)-dependent dehydrogenase (short-subunit alcohol dehydrogenase family)
MNFADRNIFITGGSRGIGLAIARKFASAGAHVAICSRTESEVFDAVIELTGLGAPVLASTLDVTDRVAVESFVERIRDRWGNVDVLVNNAGVQGPIGPFSDNDVSEWKRTMDINVIGPMQCIQAVLPGMWRAGRGKIINLSGGGSTSPRPMFSAYGASKAAIVRLTETLAVELRDRHIDVNAVAPGAVNTRMLREVLEAGENAGKEYAEARQREAGGGTPPDLAADLVLFLASEDADGITGKLLSAQWDPWQDPAFQDTLRTNPDMGTLRRIDGKHFSRIS